MFKFLSFVIFLIVGSTCYAQSDIADSLKIDSLKREMDRYTQKDTIKIKKIFDYCISIRTTDPEKEIQLLKDALKLSKELNWAKGELNILQELGFIAGTQYKFDESIPYFLEALKLSEAAGDKKQEANLHGRLSDDYRLFGNDSLRLFHAQKALEVATAIQDSVQQKKALLLVGNYYDDYNAYDRADTYYNKALQLAKEQNDDDLKYRILGFRGDRLSKQKDYKGAININKQLLTYYQVKKGLNYEAYQYAELGSLYTDIKMKDSAYFYAYKGLAFSQKHSMVKELTDAYGALYKSHYEFGDYKKAFDFKVIYDSLFNNTYNLEASQNVERARMQIAQEKIDALAKLEELKKETEVRRTRNLQFTVIGFFVLLAGFLFWNNRQKQKANSKIEKAYSELQSAQAQLIQSEKMASLGELTAGIAHEIQNPLNFVNNFAEVSNEMIDEANQELAVGTEASVQLAKEILTDIQQNLEKIHHHGKRADAIVKGMLQHSRTSTGQKELTDINSLADEYLRLSYHGLRAKDKTFNADFKTEFDTNLPKVNVLPQDIGRVLLNLINNAFYACAVRSRGETPTGFKTPSGLDDYKPTVTISTKNLGDKIEISIKDNGNGIPEEIKNKIFQPFFTTKPTGQGTGLGLSLSYDIVKAHGGELKVDTKKDEGTAFIVQLPI